MTVVTGFGDGGSLSPHKSADGEHNSPGRMRPPGSRLSGIYRIIQVLPDVILVVGLMLGWYTRWAYYESTSLFLLGIGGLFIFAFNLVSTGLGLCRERFLVKTLAYLWFGGILGIVSLLDSSELLHSASLERISNLFLMSSLVCQVLVLLLFRGCHLSRAAGHAEGPSHHRVSGLSPVTASAGVVCSSCGSVQLAELIGVAVSCTIAGPKMPPLLSLWLAFCACLVAFKLKSFLSVFCFAFLIVSAEVYLFPDINLSVNPYGVICLLVRLSAGTLIDLFCTLGGPSRLDRWHPFIMTHRYLLKVWVAIVFAIETVFIVIHGTSIGRHKEWFIMVPLFVIASSFWAILHLIFLYIWATLVNKFIRCRGPDGGSLELFSLTVPGGVSLMQLKRLLSSRGLRYFALVAQRVLYACIASTLLIAALCWTTRTAHSHAWLVVVVCLELVTTELLYEFTVTLGGTCIGYGLVAPVSPVRSDGLVAILPPGVIEEFGARSTAILNTVVAFFSRHMITNFGCDWSYSGLEMSELQKKLRLFFNQSTYEGPAYDTYLLIYSGPTTQSGNWALTNHEEFSLQSVLDLWRECRLDAKPVSGASAGDEDIAPSSKFSSGTSRLIIVCDTEYSSNWAQSVRLEKDCIVALQTYCKAKRRHSWSARSNAKAKAADPRDGVILEAPIPASSPAASYVAQAMGGALPGRFMESWVEFNYRHDANPQFPANALDPLLALAHPPDASGYDGTVSTGTASAGGSLVYGIRPIYSVSRIWTDFQFHRPTVADVKSYWIGHLPRVAHGCFGFLVGVTSAPGGVCSLISCPCFWCICRAFRRWRMRIWAPSILDTGHGFQLVSL